LALSTTASSTTALGYNELPMLWIGTMNSNIGSLASGNSGVGYNALAGRERHGGAENALRARIWRQRVPIARRAVGQPGLSSRALGTTAGPSVLDSFVQA